MLSPRAKVALKQPILEGGLNFRSSKTFKGNDSFPMRKAIKRQATTLSRAGKPSLWRAKDSDEVIYFEHIRMRDGFGLRIKQPG